MLNLGDLRNMVGYISDYDSFGWLVSFLIVHEKQWSLGSMAVLLQQENAPQGVPRRPTQQTSPPVPDTGVSFEYLELPRDHLASTRARLETPRHYFNRLVAAAVAGNDITGGVFYTFPLVAAVAGVYAPICLVISCLLLTFLRPLMLELSSAAHINGATYMYLLQFSGKLMSIVGASSTLLDAVCTTTVSAATASAYLSGEFHHLSTSPAVVTVALLIGLTLLSLAGLRESATASALIYVFHAVTMSVLAVASVVHWARTDPHSEVLRANWATRPEGAAATVRAIFYGCCVSFLGVTGFECTPAYVELMQPKTYSTVLRDLIICATIFNGVLSFIVYAILPAQHVLAGENILSTLAEAAVGSRWLRLWVVVDAVSVLLGGMLTGVITASQLLDRLAWDCVLPSIFLREMPVTKSAYVALSFALACSLLLYAASGLSLNVVSSLFSVSFLFELFQYVMSTALLKFNRPTLPVESRSSLFTLAGAFVIVVTMLIGNIVRDPLSLALFAGPYVIVFTALLLAVRQPNVSRAVLGIYSASPLSRWRFTKSLTNLLARWHCRSRSARVCVWVKTDDIHIMLEALLSVQHNAPDACSVTFLHAQSGGVSVPNDLVPNTHFLDKAFPNMSVDLRIVRDSFSPTIVAAVSDAMQVPRSRMCIISLGKGHPWSLAEYGGARVIM
ncbi:amino acid permease-domain-containing protein [Vararia minispora EC-137]|uniref:Amino acid permease-domain-containing protein n=1 Tax=Vararia minispora EC-137 TaxID=1314806 RepID=A0ACB8QF38_9AGAM|nr:amino acid permease-domain-containing protein [Vararia minispora EC-137]